MKPPHRLFVFLLFAFTAILADAVLKPKERFTIEELQKAPELTPGQFADLFQYFDFEFRARIQEPEAFLSARAGDCDDYAMLGSYVLGPKGYNTRMIQIRLVGTNVSHAVCYVTEKGAYLDYNNRRYSLNLQRAKPTVRAIAEKVADSFERNWVSAFEFTYSYDYPKKNIRWTIVQTEPSDQDADRVLAKK